MAPQWDVHIAPKVLDLEALPAKVHPSHSRTEIVERLVQQAESKVKAQSA